MRPVTIVAAPRTAALALGAIVAAIVAAVYSIGAGRAYGLDAAVTVHRFVATPSLLDPFREQAVYNNHVLFSFADHVVYTVTGSADERVLRVLPILASALAVGLVAAAVARRLGWVAGLVAAVLVAVNPMLVLTGREVRGYSLLMLACVISTLLATRLAASPAPARRLTAAYALALAVGIATHLYGLAMLPVHAAIVWPRTRRAIKRWLVPWAIGTGLGLIAYAGVAATMRGANTGRHFRPAFPLDLARDLLGGTFLTAALLAVPVALGAGELRRHGWAVRAAVAAAGVILVVWVIGPEFLFARFFVWLLPAVAVVAAVAVARRPLLAVLVLAMALVSAGRLEPDFGRSDLSNRLAAGIAQRVQRAGHVPCTAGLSALAMEPYRADIRLVAPQGPAPACDVYFNLTPGPGLDPGVPAAWLSSFPERRVLGAAYPGVAISRRPLSELAGGR